MSHSLCILLSLALFLPKMRENNEAQMHLLENSRTDGCIHSSGVTSLGLRYTLSRALSQAHTHKCMHIHKEKHIHAHSCVQTRSGMRLATYMHRVCSWRRIPIELYVGIDGAGGCGTGARISVRPRSDTTGECQ